MTARPTPRVHYASRAELAALEAQEAAATANGTRAQFDAQQRRDFQAALAADRADLRAWRKAQR